MKTLPSANGGANGVSGRNKKTGQFVTGNSGGPGRKPGPQPRYRGALIRCVDQEPFGQIVAQVIKAAKAGEPWALREMLDRTLGKASQPIEGILGVYAVQPTDEDVAAAAEIIGRRLTYGQATATR